MPIRDLASDGHRRRGPHQHDLLACVPLQNSAASVLGPSGGHGDVIAACVDQGHEHAGDAVRGFTELETYIEALVKGR